MINKNLIGVLTNNDLKPINLPFWGVEDGEISIKKLTLSEMNKINKINKNKENEDNDIDITITLICLSLVYTKTKEPVFNIKTDYDLLKNDVNIPTVNIAIQEFMEEYSKKKIN